MTHDYIERVIGRLLTDEQFRRAFIANPEQLLASLTGDGAELSDAEVAALLDTDVTAWIEAAECLDPRLQKVALTRLKTAAIGPPHRREP